MAKDYNKNRNELDQQLDNMDYARSGFKDLRKDIKETIKSYDSAFGKNNEAIAENLRKSSELRELYRDINKLMLEQAEALKAIDSSVEDIANQTQASKENIVKALPYFQKIKELEDERANANDSEKQRIDDDIEAEKKKIELLDSQLKDVYDNQKDKILDLIDKQKDLAEATQEATEAQNKLAESVTKTNMAIVRSSLWAAIKSVATSSYDKLKEVDQASRDFGRHMGMSAEQMDTHRTHMVENWGQMAKRLGMDFKEMYKFQTNYAEATDKAIILTDRQVSTMAAVSRNTGEQALEMATKNLDIFASSADASIEYMGKAIARASLEGLNVKKYSEAFASNIKMASKYTFKEGITGIQKMTLLSQRLKFNMESMGAAMDKFSNIESAIETSAKIQVLGGAFAQNFGNPLEVMSNALLDAEGFTKRIIDSVSRQAFFNKETGEVDLAPIDKMRLKEFAASIGISYEEVFNMSTQQRKASMIEQAAKGKGFNEEQIAYLANKGQYDKEKQEYYVTDTQGKKTYMSELSALSLDELRNRDSYEKIIAADTEEIKDILNDKTFEERSLEEIQKGWSELYKLWGASQINNVYGLLAWSLPIIAGAQFLGGGKNLLRGVKGLFKTSRKGLSATMASNATNGASVSLATKIGNNMRGIKIGGVVVSGIAAGIQGLNAKMKYSNTKDEILDDKKTTIEAKARALNEAKKERNKGYGGAAGGFAASLGLAKAGALLGSGFGPVGTLIGGAVGGLVGYFGGSSLGGAVGEAMTQSVSDTKKELEEGMGIVDKNAKSKVKEEELQLEKENNETLAVINDKMSRIYGLMGSQTYAVNNNNRYSNEINSVKYNNVSQSSIVKVEDMKVNIDGKIQLVGNNGRVQDINDLIGNKTFVDGIKKIVTDAMAQQSSARVQKTSVA